MALASRTKCAQRDIADYLGQTEASISRQIKLLIEKGLLQTSTSPQNRREHLTTLTGKGQRLLDKAIELLNNHYQPMFTKLTSGQQETFAAALGVMHDHACQINCGCEH